MTTESDLRNIGAMRAITDETRARWKATDRRARRARIRNRIVFALVAIAVFWAVLF